MLDESGAGLSVGFAIETGGSFDDLARLATVMDSTEAKITRDAKAIEAATAGMVKVGNQPAAITAIAAASTKAARDMARAQASAEKAGERVVFGLERQIATFGKSKAEVAAYNAELNKLPELAERIREKEATLVAMRDNAAAATRAQAAAVAQLAEATATAQFRERAQLEAALERTTGLGRIKATDAGATYSALADLDRQLELTEKTAAAERELIAVQRQQNSVLAERANIEAALSRTMGTDRPRATDAGATFSALAAKAAEDEARAQTLAAAAVKRAADEHARLAALVQGSHAAQEADAAAAERLRERTDPLYAAIKRLNAEIAESTRLYHAGATAPAEYARQQEVLTQRLALAGQQHNALAGAAGKSSFALRQFAIQTPDIAQGLLTGQKPMTIFIQQGGQLAQIAMMAEGGIKGFLAALAPAAIAAAPFIAAAAAVAGGFALFERSVGKGVDTKAMIDGLGLTRAEMKRLKDTSVGVGDVVKATFQVMAKNVGLNLAGMTKGFGSALDWMTTVSRKALAGLYAGFLGTFKAIGAIVTGVFSGKSLKEIGKDAVAAYTDIYKEADAKLGKFGQAVTDQVRKDKLADLQRQATEIKKDRTPKTDRHAEQLGRENEAIEAQIKNLYRLAAAYGVSGEAALIAEARTKAETDAIKKRGDIEEFVGRQIRLAVAERVKSGAEAAATLRDQARIQTEVNGEVAAGNLPFERANDLLQQRIAQLPLLQAIEAAYQTGRVKDALAAEAQLDKLIEAQKASDAAMIGARAVADHQAAERRLAELTEELRLVGATDAARAHALTTIRATNEAVASGRKGQQVTDYVADQVRIADETERLAAAQRDWNDELAFTADRWDLIARNAQQAAQGMADAFGSAGRAVGDMAAIYASYEADRARADEAHKTRLLAAGSEAARDRESAKYLLATSTRQIGLYGDMAAAAKGFFSEKSKGYQALAAAEKVFRAAEFALSVKAMAQDAAETASKVAGSVFRTAKYAVEAVVKAISSLPFPANLAAGAATVGALAAIGVSVAGGGGGGTKPVPANEGTGTVLGDSAAKSESIKRAIDQLREVDTVMLSHSREMAASLRSIDRQIGGFAAQILKAGDINANGGIQTGFKMDTTGSLLKGIITGGGLFSKVPVVGGIINAIGSIVGGLFGSKTTITGTGLYGGPQSLGSVLSGGFDASNYTDVKKQKKFFGITTGTSYSTQYSSADPSLENQFTLILRSFNDAIAAAAGPLGESTDAIQQRLSGFVVNIGKIDLSGLTGEQVTEKLTAVFGAAADQMAGAAFPGVARWQKAGEGLFETAVRVASTVEAVTSALGALGTASQAFSIDAKLGLAAQFDSVSEMSTAAETYFERYYSKQEQAAARLAQFGDVFGSLGVSMPASLVGFRQLVDSQNLTTEAGQRTYATLLRLAPAFADLQESMNGAKSAADVLAERQDLERKLLELNGDTAAIRALDLAKLDESNRALQLQIYAIQDAQKAAQAADELRQAWTSVGDSIMDEVRRIRGLDEAGGGSFAQLQGRFNVANAAARGGDMDAAKTLTALSQALLAQAEKVATSRQELDRVRAQTAAALEGTYGAISSLTGAGGAVSVTALLAAAAQQTTSSPQAANDTASSELRALREEVAAMRRENNAGHAATAGNTGRMARKLDDVTAQSGGDAISTVAAA